MENGSGDANRAYNNNTELRETSISGVITVSLFSSLMWDHVEAFGYGHAVCHNSY